MHRTETVKTALKKLIVFLLEEKRHLSIVTSLTFAYVLVFWLFIDQMGLILSVLLSVPVIAIGFYFGRGAGLFAGMFGFVLNTFLLINRGDFNTDQVTHFWLGYLIVLVLGFVAGYIHDESVTQKRTIREGDSQERFITLVGIATKSIKGTKNPGEAYYRLITHLTNLFVADYGYLIRWDETTEQASLVAATKTLEDISFPHLLKSEEANLIRAVLESGHSMFIEDVGKSLHIIDPSPFNSLSLQTRSALVIPLITEDFYFGVVTLAFDSLHRFAPEEILYVELAGSQIALALRTLQQQHEIELQLKEARALANIERALSESERVGVDKVLQLIVDSAIELIPKAKNVILHLLDNEKQILIPRAVAGYKETTKGKLNMRPGEGVAGQVMASKEVIRIPDVHNDSRFINQKTPVQFQSLVVAPIKSHDECIGTISIHSDIPNAFNDNEVTLLETLGTQVSIGIDNANLLETLEQRVQQRTHDLIVLYNLITIISENWRLQDLLELSLVLTLETLKADRGIMYLVDGKEIPSLKPVIQRGFGDGFEVEIDNLPDDELANNVLKQHKPLSLDNLTDNPAYEKFNGMNSYAGIPILARGEVRGVFSLFANEKGAFGSDEMALLSSIADHLGIGIDNSLLWEQSRENAALEERNRLARNLHDSVSQQLYSLTLMAGSAKKMLERDHDLEAVRNSISRLGDTAHQALKEMRLLLYELRPAVLDSEGLVSALQHRIETVEERLGVKVKLQAQGIPDLPSNVEDALYHIALEALNNVVKHSEGSEASITFIYVDGSVSMEISDNGKGFDTDQRQKGLGLRNMRERVQILGGAFSIDSTPDNGTRVRVTVGVPSVSMVES